MMSQPPSSRKRSASAMSLSDSQDNVSHLPRDSINPLSHTPSVLRQLQLAGLSDTDQPPSRTQARFPHRAWQPPDAPTRRGATTTTPAKPLDSDGDGQEEKGPDKGGKRRTRKRDGENKPKYALERAPFRPLVRAINGFLDNGDVTNAKRAFGILMRSHVQGKPIDIRRNNYWALGAEILMRDGSRGGGDADEGQETEAYPVENIPRVREYFQDLIQRYPYNHMHRDAVSSIDFWPTLLSYEVYQEHAQQMASLRRLERETEDWEDDSWQEPSFGGGNDGMMLDDIDFKDEAPVRQADTRDIRLRHARDQIRIHTLNNLRLLAGRMDALFEDRDFSSSHELLRLRGMLSLYIGDLLVPAHTHTERQMAEAQVRRDTERKNARNSFQRMLDCGGRPDNFLQRILASSEDDEGPALPVFSSLPIREYRRTS